MSHPRRMGRGLRSSLGLIAGSRGFSLIELLVVIIILGLLAGLVGPRLFGRVGQSKQAAAKAQIELFGAALDQYRLDVGSQVTRTRGFTLIELAVTLLILALAAAVAAPSLARGVDTVRARTEAAGIATFLRAAHEQAVTQH